MTLDRRRIAQLVPLPLKQAWRTAGLAGVVLYVSLPPIDCGFSRHWERRSF
ncbi:hypothetical protein QMZ92_11570 [Streptomyces sp. HNM0645]|uniref:hypothetical protein n=1 Tax=Streptomyces sp. HNM0645 TaxID=2782343 RepID=UPI0024B7F91E|nr:hypothetical protein [Streptomyces sp. HNM0645]MDI9885013.1 hypothetical protein [Streptomyces sp. HNM0645]